METLWVESEAPEARPVFPPSSFFNLLASVSMAKLLRLLYTTLRPLLRCLQIEQIKTHNGSFYYSPHTYN